MVCEHSQDQQKDAYTWNYKSFESNFRLDLKNFFYTLWSNTLRSNLYAVTNRIIWNNYASKT